MPKSRTEAVGAVSTPLGTATTAAYESFILPLPLQKITGEQRAPGSMLAFKSAVLLCHGVGRGVIEILLKSSFKPKPVDFNEQRLP